MSRFCGNCGTALSPNDRFCNACGMRVQETSLPDKAQPTEVDYGQETPGPLGYFRERICAGFHSVQQLFKNPKRLIPIAVLVVSWLILAILPALGVNPLPVKVLSLITFAQGGMFNGIWGAIGGVIGKAIYAYFISALVIPLFSGNKPFRRSGSKGDAAKLTVQGVNAASPLLVGFGLALVIYNFLTGNADIINSMAGVMGLILAIRSILRERGFLWGLLLSIMKRIFRAGASSRKLVSRTMTGYAIGSASGVALSAVPWPDHPLTAYIPYMFGCLLLISGLILHIAIKPGKEPVPA